MNQELQGELRCLACLTCPTTIVILVLMSLAIWRGINKGRKARAEASTAGALVQAATAMSTKPHLVVRDTQKFFELNPGAVMTIGSSDAADITVQDASVAGFHAEIRLNVGAKVRSWKIRGTGGKVSLAQSPLHALRDVGRGERNIKNNYVIKLGGVEFEVRIP